MNRTGLFIILHDATYEKVVGVDGFEPPASRARPLRSDRLSYTPIMDEYVAVKRKQIMIVILKFPTGIGVLVLLG